ncbi:unnamed protein product, partial [Polarella glacialis]
ASFPAFADTFWKLCPAGRRQDVADAGGEYRSLVGLPGGSKSPFYAQLQQAAGSPPRAPVSTVLVPGAGDEGDNYGTNSVLVYDTSSFPAHVAEKYHQFHDDMQASYGSKYNALRSIASATKCPGDQASSFLGWFH